MSQKGVQDNKPNAHESKLTNLEGRHRRTFEPNEATKDHVTGVKYLLCHVDPKPVVFEVSPITIKSPNISSIPVNPQKKPAFKNYRTSTVADVMPEEPVQTPSHSHTETNASSRPDKKKQAKRSRIAKKAPKGPDEKVQIIGRNTRHTAGNLHKFTAKSLKCNITLSQSDEEHEGQKKQQKAKKAKKAHESRFGLDEAMMDAPASLSEIAANSPNQRLKRKLQSLETQQVAEMKPKRVKKSHQTKGIEDGEMMNVDPAGSDIPTMAPPTTTGATATSLKRGVATPEARGAAISSKTAKRQKQKHEGKLPIDVCIEFEDITQLVDVHLREKEEKRDEERKRREAPKILKLSRGATAGEAVEEAGKSAKKLKAAEEAERPEPRKA